MTPLPDPQTILQAHTLYCELTGQRLSLGFDRERRWFELLRTGISLEDIRRVICYLQREIRENRRNLGALKLSNLLEPERFEEDLQISKIRLQPPPPQPNPKPSPPPVSPEQEQHARQRALDCLRKLRRSLR